MFNRIKNAVSSFIRDERGGEVPTTAIIAAVLAVAGLGIATVILTHVKSTTQSTGGTIDQAAQQQY